MYCRLERTGPRWGYPAQDKMLTVAVAFREVEKLTPVTFAVLTVALCWRMTNALLLGGYRICRWLAQ